MKRFNKILSSIILASPIALFAACYGPAPYDCSKDSDCSYLKNGRCLLQKEEDYYGNKGGYCTGDDYIDDSLSDADSASDK